MPLSESPGGVLLNKTAALLPPALLLLFAGGCGTFAGGATFAGAAVGMGAVLGMAVLGAGAWRDPLALGRGGRWLVAALLLAVGVSWWVSPVPAAGVRAVVLLPAGLLLPAAVARCWRGEAARRLGPRATAVVVGIVALWAFVEWYLTAAERPAQPLGHHTLLGAWLLTLLPLALAAARERGSWRWISLAAGLLAVAAVIATRSLLAGLGLAAMGVMAAPAVLVAPRGRRPAAGGRWWWIAAALLAALLPLLPLMERAARILALRDSSLLVRLGYWRGAWRGFLESPWWGWGPGATPWTAGAFLRPVPGIHPPGEMVGDFHSLPLQTAFELGLPGLLLGLAAAGLFAWRRLDVARRDSVAAAGLLGLAGLAVFLLGSGALGTTALPVAAAVAAGAALTGISRQGEDEIPGSRGAAAGVGLYVLIALLALAPGLLAQRHYEGAAEIGAGEEARAEAERAAARAPGFALYPARAAWLAGEAAPGDADPARRALDAAEAAPGVGPLWLAAGAMGVAAGEPWAEGALLRACALDPLSPMASFLLLEADPAVPGAPHHGARALLADPRLAAALLWRRHPGLLERSLERALAWPGVDEGWRLALANAVRSVPRGEETARLELAMDARDATAVSLYLFRRRSWPATLAGVELDLAAARSLTLPPATTLATTSPAAFSPATCAAASPAGAGRGRADPWSDPRAKPRR